jgi:selenoprotein W-related protein
LADHLLTLKQDIASVKLVPSRGGVFELDVNGRNIYSKLQTGEFPEKEMVFRKVKDLL